MELAVFEDCSLLIKNFVSLKEPSFEKFCICWKKMNFHHIYAAQSTTVEVLQTTKAIFHIARQFVAGEKYLCKDESIEQILDRIGGLYLMYAIYFKQPTEQYVKIQMTLSTWQNLRDFVTSSPLDAKDVQYIFLKLWQCHAFRFTVLPEHVGLEQLVNYDNISEYEATSGNTLACTKLKHELQMFSNIKQILPALTTFEEGYNGMKEKLASESGISKQALPTTTIFTDISKSFQRMQNILDDDKFTETNGEEQNTKDCAKFKGGKRTSIYSPIEEDELAVDSSKTSSTRNLRRMSARTIFSESLSQDLLNELEEQNDDLLYYDELDSDLDADVDAKNKSDVENTDKPSNISEILSFALNDLE